MDLTNLTIDEIWSEIAGKAQEEKELTKDLKATYTFHIKDDKEYTYSLIFTDGEVEVKEGQVADPNCELSMNGKNFKKLLVGELNATSAFMTRRLKVKGNIGDALKLEQILKNYSF